MKLIFVFQVGYLIIKINVACAVLFIGIIVSLCCNLNLYRCPMWSVSATIAMRRYGYTRYIKYNIVDVQLVCKSI